MEFETMAYPDSKTNPSDEHQNDNIDHKIVESKIQTISDDVPIEAESISDQDLEELYDTFVAVLEDVERLKCEIQSFTETKNGENYLRLESTIASLLNLLKNIETHEQENINAVRENAVKDVLYLEKLLKGKAKENDILKNWAHYFGRSFIHVISSGMFTKLIFE